MDYKVKLDVFEGPLDLLLHLVKKNELDIYDIPMATVVEQYLDYLGLMESINIDLAGGFILMAATLVGIKARMLLPEPPAEDEEEDPRLELVGPLLDHLKVKDAAEMLERREILNRDVFLRPVAGEEAVAVEPEHISEVGLFDLLDAFKEILEGVAEPMLTVEIEESSVEERMAEIAEALRRAGSLVFQSLFAPGASRKEVIVSFLALLEMVKARLVRVIQDELSGLISILPAEARVVHLR